MIIIPARLQSSRYPQKMLADIAGLPLVVRTAKNAAKVDEVVIACDDEKILDVCKAHKIRAILTDKSHSSGTDRCAQACRILGLKNDEIILNIQGDEPFLESSVIQTLADITRQSPFMASLAKKITPNDSLDPNLVKVILDSKNFAIYFSRAPIPYLRDKHEENPPDYLGHLGLYGFSNESLQEFCRLEKSKIEEIEKLEQLRAIYHQKPIKMAIVQTESIGVDTEDDLQHARLLAQKIEC